MRIRTVRKCFNIYLVLIATLSRGKFESIQLQCEELTEKSNKSRKMIFIFQVLRPLTVDTAIYPQIACNLFSR